MSFEKIPMTKLTRVYQRKSKNDVTYFVGRLGASKILLFKDEKLSESSDNPVWNVLLQEVVEKPEGSSTRTSDRKHVSADFQRGIDSQAPLESGPNDKIPF